MTAAKFRRIGLFGGPLLGLLCYHLLPLQYSTGAEQWVEFSVAGRATLGMMVWMATWWITEAVDIEVTALLPIATFPLLGIHRQRESRVCRLAPRSTPACDYDHDRIPFRAHLQHSAGGDHASGACCYGAKTRNRSLCPGHRVHVGREQCVHDAGGHAAECNRVRNRAGADAANDEGGNLAEPIRHPGHNGAVRAVTLKIKANAGHQASCNEQGPRTPTERKTSHASVATMRQIAVCAPDILIVVMGAAPDLGPLRAEPESLEQAKPELIKRLRADQYDYFRFVNRSWIARACDIFEADVRDLPVVRLHGDAHVEQFAVAQDEWGLDDFDDSARGPAAIDIVRFLGSIDLAVRQRSWERDRDRLFDRFIEGYKRGLTEPNYRPPPPDIVRRLRAQAPPTRAAFLAWGETRMQPLADASMKAVVAGIEASAQVVLRERPDLAPEYFRVVRAGSFQAESVAP